MAIYTAMVLGAGPFGSLAFGQLGQWIGALQSLFAGALLALAAAAASALWLRAQQRSGAAL
jgi:hypothetical protein